MGDRIILVKRPNPKWNSNRLCELMYSETNLMYKIPRWIGTQEEIDEILNMPELTYYEWKEVLEKFLNNDSMNNENTLQQILPSKFKFILVSFIVIIAYTLLV